MRGLLISIAATLVFLLPTTSSAILWNYTAGGYINADDVLYPVVGNITISDTWIYTDNPTFDDIYSFDFVNFSLLVDGWYNFSGDNGGLYYIQQILQPDTGNWVYEEQWSLYKSQEEWWNQPYGGSIKFFTSAGELYAPTNTSSEYFGLLAPIIELDGPNVGYSPFFPNGSSNDIWGKIVLTRNPAPVPEPASLLLLGTGIAGLAGHAWRKRRSPEH